MQKKLLTALISVLIVIVITILSNEFGDLLGIPYLWSGLMIILMAITCKANTEFTFDKAFVWTFLSYIAGKAISLAIVVFLMDDAINGENISYSFSSISYGDINENVSKIINWLMEPSVAKRYFIELFITLYKGIAVSLLI